MLNNDSISNSFKLQVPTAMTKHNSAVGSKKSSVLHDVEEEEYLQHDDIEDLIQARASINRKNHRHSEKHSNQNIMKAYSSSSEEDEDRRSTLSNPERKRGFSLIRWLRDRCSRCFGNPNLTTDFTDIDQHAKQTMGKAKEMPNWRQALENLIEKSYAVNNQEIPQYVQDAQNNIKSLYNSKSFQSKVK